MVKGTFSPFLDDFFCDWKFSCAPWIECLVYLNCKGGELFGDNECLSNDSHSTLMESSKSWLLLT